jgi:tRNA pseudouridine32 synthase/23S rRNA pseudouridine746 synthase
LQQVIEHSPAIEPEKGVAVNLKLTVPSGASPLAADFLAQASGLAKARIKDAMVKGAVLLKRGKTTKRLRRATFTLMAGDTLKLAYDAEILAREAPVATCLQDLKHYSVWIKPAGLLSQGNDFGDHCALLRQAELFFKSTRPVFLVHRLDREAAGLMLVAHTPKGAAALSTLFREGRINKVYQAEVLGCPAEPQGSIAAALDGKPARTTYRVLASHPEQHSATLEVIIHTGRRHQIRRHLALIGHPVLGDPRYGSNNKNTAGLQLTAVALGFICPLRKKAVTFALPEATPKKLIKSNPKAAKVTDNLV